MPEKKEKVEIVNVRGKNFLVNSPDITRDYFTNEWILIRDATKLASKLHLHKLHGLQDILEWKYISFHTKLANKNRIITLKTAKGQYQAISNYTVIGNGKIHESIREDEKGYIFYDDYLNMTANNKNKFRTFDNTISVFKDINNSEISDIDKKELLERDILFGVRTFTNKIFEGLEYSFGVELETSSGRLSVEDTMDLNLKCEFDGSLRDQPGQSKETVLGGEYVTGILVGDSGMHQLNKICTMLSEKCTINDKCGVHVHLGNIKFTKENVVYMYILGTILQNEIFSMMPKSRRGNSYCRPIKDLGLKTNNLNCSTSILYNISIDEYYNSICKEVYGGKVPDKKTNKNYQHPSGAKCGYNKESQRYTWLNFVTAICNTRGNKAYTLEFRNHYATLNYIKVKNWLKICVAFVNFAENHQNSIRRGYWMDKCENKYPICLSSIVKAAYPRTNKIVEEYIEEKKSFFLLDTGELESLEYKNDKKGLTNLNKKECVL